NPGKVRWWRVWHIIGEVGGADRGEDTMFAKRRGLLDAVMWGVLMLLPGMTGCAAGDLAPQWSSAFTGESRPQARAQAAPSEVESPLQRSPARLGKPLLAPERAGPPVVTVGFVAQEEKSLPENSAGITLDEAIQQCLEADPKLRAGFE